jgi:prepilin-type N-terminal cleavage/methylation domain-containing protein
MSRRTHQPGAFTLLEILVALAILSIMMAFLSTMIGSGARLWETGNKRIEATQAARVGLNTIERELRKAFAGQVTTYKSDGTAVQNTAPFEAIGTPTDTLGLEGGASNAEGSQQLRAVVSTGDPADPYKEIGLMCVHLGSGGYGAMEGGRYYCVLAQPYDAAEETYDGNFFQQTPAPWAFAPSEEENFLPLMDNCIRLTFRYYGDQNTGDPNDPAYNPDWTAAGWSPQNPAGRPPLGVLVTLTVLDSRSAEKVDALTSGAALSDADISGGITAAQAGNPANNIQRLVAQGAVTMSRFIPFNRH